MDISKELMEEIVKRVAAKIAELDQTQGNPAAQTPAQPAAEAEEKVTYTRRLLSEKDIVEHNKAGVNKIVYSKNTIVTDVAKDYAKQYEIELIKQG